MACLQQQIVTPFLQFSVHLPLLHHRWDCRSECTAHRLLGSRDGSPFVFDVTGDGFRYSARSEKTILVHTECASHILIIMSMRIHHLHPVGAEPLTLLSESRPHNADESTSQLCELVCSGSKAKAESASS